MSRCTLYGLLALAGMLITIPATFAQDPSAEPPAGEEPRRPTGRENATQRSQQNAGKEVGNGTLQAREGRPGKFVKHDDREHEPTPGDVERKKMKRLPTPNYSQIADTQGKFLGLR